jgi:hypothetical protein
MDNETIIPTDQPTGVLNPDSQETVQTTELTDVSDTLVTPVTPEPVLEEKTHVYQPTDELGRPIGGKQVIKFRTTDELVAKMQEQSVLLIRKLREQTKKNRLGINDLDEISAEAPKFESPIDFQPRVLTPDQRVKLSRDLLDPENLDEATDTLFEAKFGIKPQTLGKVVSDLQADNINMKARLEADAFVAANPSYVICGENFSAITNWMLRYDLAPVRENFQKAYDTLRADGILIERSEPEQVVESTPSPTPVVTPTFTPTVTPASTDEPVVEPKPTTYAPSRIASGLTRDLSTDVGTVRPVGDDIVYEVIVGGQKRVYKGLAALDAMPSDVYKHRINHEKGFAQKAEKVMAEAEKKKR